MGDRAGDVQMSGFSAGIVRGILKDIVITMAMVLILIGILYAYTGVWPPLVSVDGMSMYPNLHSGDLVVLRGLGKVAVHTGQASANDSYKKFNGYGDVIVYSPMGNRSLVPVIHRAVYWVNGGEPMWPGGPAAPHAGYITLGDNNYFYDQSTSISPDEPVRPEWILGVPQFKIPYLGLLRSYI